MPFGSFWLVFFLMDWLSFGAEVSVYGSREWLLKRASHLDGFWRRIALQEKDS